MQINYNVEMYDYNKRYRNLTACSHSKVKSEKFFPVFIKDKNEYIFKPLSKTKPFTTPFFSYSELIWSHIIKKYFYKSAPIYNLAYCENYNENVPKYYNIGTIVPSIIEEDEKLINLYEYFINDKDEFVDIENYINYCLVDYDYTSIFKSKIFMENKDLAKDLVLQILLSILRADQNFHYENINFIYKNNKIISLAPPIDYEFSSMFMFLDKIEENQKLVDDYIENLNPTSSNSILSSNIDYIIENYKEEVVKFIDILDLMISDISKNKIILENNNYITAFNSYNFMIGQARYKEYDEDKAKKFENLLTQYVVNLDKVSKRIFNNIIKVSEALKHVLLCKLNESKINIYEYNKKDSKESLYK